MKKIDCTNKTVQQVIDEINITMDEKIMENLDLIQGYPSHVYIINIVRILAHLSKTSELEVRVNHPKAEILTHIIASIALNDGSLPKINFIVEEFEPEWFHDIQDNFINGTMVWSVTGKY